MVSAQKVLLLAALALSFLAAAPGVGASHDPAPVTVAGNAGFLDTTHWSGSGTVADPYRPTFTTIVAAGGRGLELSGTQAHVNLSGLTITGGSTHSDGIRLYNVRNVTIWGSTLESNRWGVHIRDSANLTLASNTIKTSLLGVYIEASTNITLRDNRISLNDADVQFRASTGNTLVNNNLSVATSQYGLSFSDNASYDNSIDATNVVNSIPVRWYTRLNGAPGAPIVISDISVDLPRMTNVAQIMVHNSSHVRFERPIAKAGAASGIHVHLGAGIELVAPTAEGNAGNGIFGEVTSGLRISNASARNNTLGGVVMQSVQDAALETAALSGNGLAGARVSAGANVVALRNLTVASNRGNGVLLESSRNVTLEFSTLTSDAPAEVSLSGSRDIVVRNNTLSGAGVSGITLTGSTASILSNSIRDRTTAIAFTAATNSTLADNIIALAPGGIGISFDGPASYDNTIATTNTVNGTPVRWYTNVAGPLTLPALNVELRGITNVAQIMLYRTTNVTLTDAVAKNGTVAGLIAYESHGANFTSATSSSNAQQGLFVVSGSALQLRGSTLTVNGVDAVKIVSSAGALLENNIVQSNGGRGIAIETSTAPTLRGNAVASNGGGGIVFDRVGPGAAVADHNVVQSNGGGGILASASTIGAIRSNTIASNGPDGIALSAISASAVVDANSITDHTRGIRLTGAAGTQFMANSINMSADQTGIHFDDEASYNVSLPPTTTVNGVPVRWYAGTSGATVSNASVELRGITNVAQVMLYRTANVTLLSPVATNGTARGIYVFSSENSTIEGGRAENNTRAGIHFHASREMGINGTRSVKNLLGGAVVFDSPGARVTNATFESNLGTGLMIDASGAPGAKIENNTARLNRGGIRISASNVSLLQGNDLSANGDAGLSLVSATLAAATGNRFEGHVRNIELTATTSAVFRDNVVTILANQTAWHFATDSYRNQVNESNRVNDVPMRWYSGVSGLSLVGVRAELKGMTNVAQVMVFGSPGAIIEDVRAANGTARGLFIENSLGTRVNGSRFENNAGDGLVVSFGGDVSVSNSTSRQNVGHGVRASASVTLDNVTLSQNGANGAFIDQAVASVRAANVERNNASGLHAVASSSLNVSRSNFTANAGGGITTDRATAPAFFDNELAGNGAVGISLDRAAGFIRVAGNRVANHTRGIELRETEFADIAANVITIDSGQIGLHFQDERSYNNVIATSNTVNLQPIHWYTTLAGTESAPVTIHGVRSELRGVTNVAQVMVYRSAYVRIPEVVATNGTARGIYVYRSSAVTLDDANVTNNTLYGVHLQSSQSNVVRNLSAQASGAGVQLTDSANNLVVGVNATGATTGVILSDAAARDNRIERVETNGSAKAVQDAGWNGQGLAGNNLVADAGTLKRGKISTPFVFADAMATYRLESNRIVNQTWSFGDGANDSTSTGAALFRPMHAYGVAGWYRANLTVVTADGSTLVDSVAVEIVPPLSAPRALVATSGARTVTLNWTAPEFDGASPILSYRLYRGVNATEQPFLVELGANSNGTLDKDLVNGRTYYYAVSATNADGEGPKAAITASPVASPGAPTSVVAKPGPNSVTLTWAPPADVGGVPIFGYQVVRSINGSAFGVVAALGNVTSHTDVGLANGVPYTFAVRGQNAIGSGVLSSNATATPIGPPSAPRELRVLPGDASATLLWSAPADDGGKPVTGYRVWRGGSNETPVALPETLAANATSHRATGLSNGRAYIFSVSALNAVGEGVRSANVSGKPAALDTLRPVVFEQFPPPGAFLAESPLEVRALYVDNDGIVSEGVRVYLDDAQVGANASSVGFVYVLPTSLDLGRHSVRVVARDPSGNEANESWSFRILSPEERMAVLEFANHTLLPENALPGANVTARVAVRNVGYLNGTASLNISLGGNPLAFADAEVPHGESVEMFLDFSAPTVEGVYELLFDGRSIALTVAEESPEAPTNETTEVEPTAEGPRRPVRGTPTPRAAPSAETPGPAVTGALAALGAAALVARRRK